MIPRAFAELTNMRVSGVSLSSWIRSVFAEIHQYENVGFVTHSGAYHSFQTKYPMPGCLPYA